MLRDASGILSNQDAYFYLSKISDEYVERHPNGSVTFDRKMVAGRGASSGCNPEDLIVGIRGIRNTSTLPVNEKKFMRSLVSINHEIQHSEQYCTIQNQDSSYGREIGLARCAMATNKYLATENYYYDPCEVDAERTGMRWAFVFCKNHFGDDKANQMMCKYVNDRIDHKVSFIHPEHGRHYHDAVDIFYDIDVAYERSIHTHREYDVQKGLKENDQLARFLTEQPQYKDVFLNEPDGYRQDKMSAAVALDYDGASYEERNLPGLQDITISSAFSRDESHENKVTQAEEKFGHITDVSDVKYDEYEP